jgi:hypothetical protein
MPYIITKNYFYDAFYLGDRTHFLYTREPHYKPL